MVGELVYFHPGDCGEHVGMVVAQKPRTKLYVVVYEASATKYKSIEVETVRSLTHDVRGADGLMHNRRCPRLSNMIRPR